MPHQNSGQLGGVSQNRTDIPNARMGSSDVRGNKMQKTAYDKKKDWQAFPVKVHDLN